MLSSGQVIFLDETGVGEQSGECWKEKGKVFGTDKGQHADS